MASKPILDQKAVVNEIDSLAEQAQQDTGIVRYQQAASAIAKRYMAIIEKKRKQPGEPGAKAEGDRRTLVQSLIERRNKTEWKAQTVYSAAITFLRKEPEPLVSAHAPAGRFAPKNMGAKSRSK